MKKKIVAFAFAIALGISLMPKPVHAMDASDYQYKSQVPCVTNSIIIDPEPKG